MIIGNKYMTIIDRDVIKANLLIFIFFNNIMHLFASYPWYFFICHISTNYEKNSN